jgi:predicted metal-dependent phosphoesterase TrpH
MKTQGIVDLHCHTHFSDGLLSPSALIEMAVKQKIKLLAVTDHDLIDSYPPCLAAAKEHDITLIPGVEITTQWQGSTIHLVGLAFLSENENLVQGMKSQKVIRHRRFEAMSERFNAASMADVPLKACEISGPGIIGRLHFAQALVQLAYVKTIQKAFSRYLTKGKMGFAPIKWPDMETAIKWIHGAGGVVVLAHPCRYKATLTRIKRLVSDFKEAGGDGIEVVTGSHTEEEIALVAEIAEKYDLYASQGSDYHGPGLGIAQLGRLRPMPEKCRPIWDLWQ